MEFVIPHSAIFHLLCDVVDMLNFVGKFCFDLLTVCLMRINFKNQLLYMNR